MNRERLKQIRTEERELEEWQSQCLDVYDDPDEDSETQRIAKHKALQIDYYIDELQDEKHQLEKLAEIEDEKVQVLNAVFKPRTIAEILSRHKNPPATAKPMPQTTAKKGGRRL